MYVFHYTVSTNCFNDQVQGARIIDFRKSAEKIVSKNVTKAVFGYQLVQSDAQTIR